MNCLVASDRFEFPLLQHTQTQLDICVSSGNSLTSSRKRVLAIGEFEPADMPFQCAGERASLVLAEQLTFYEAC